MVFVIPLLVESFVTDLANKRFISQVYSHVSVQRGAPVETFSALLASMGPLLRVDDLVAA